MPAFQTLTHCMENFIASPAFLCSVWFVIFLLFCELVKVLYKFLFRKICSAFEKVAPLDEGLRKKVSRFTFLFSLFFPLMQVSGFIWVGVLRGHGRLQILGLKLSFGFGFVQAILACCFCICCIRLIHLFHKHYNKSDSGHKRPIHAFVNILYVLLCSFSLFALMSFVTRERPIVLMSTFGAVFAIFVFAFKNYLSSMTANIQLNVERVVKVGDWIVVDSHNIDGIVESISARTIQVRNWDMSLALFPVKMLTDETFLNYSAMQASGARQMKRPLLIDQKSVRFLTQEEINTLKENKLLTDEILSRAESFDDTSKLSPCRLWTNLELFCLYAEDYLARRKDIRHDLDCIMRVLASTGTGIPVEIYCYETSTSLVAFEERIRVILCHFLAVLPSFHLRIYQVSTIKKSENPSN